MASSIEKLPSELIDQICAHLDRKSLLSLRHATQYLAIHTTHALSSSFERIAVTSSKAGLERLDRLVSTSDDDASAALRQRILPNITHVTLHLLTAHGLEELVASMPHTSVDDRYLQAYTMLHQTLIRRLNKLPCPWTLEITNEHFNGVPDPDVLEPAYKLKAETTAKSENIWLGLEKDRMYAFETALSVARSLVEVDSIEVSIDYGNVVNQRLIKNEPPPAVGAAAANPLTTIFGGWPQPEVLEYKMEKFSLCGSYMSDNDARFWNQVTKSLAHCKIIDMAASTPQNEDVGLHSIYFLEWPNTLENNLATLQQFVLEKYKNDFHGWATVGSFLKRFTQLEVLIMRNCEVRFDNGIVAIRLHVYDGIGMLRAREERYSDDGQDDSVVEKVYSGTKEEILDKLDEIVDLIRQEFSEHTGAGI